MNVMDQLRFDNKWRATAALWVLVSAACGSTERDGSSEALEGATAGSGGSTPASGERDGSGPGGSGPGSESGGSPAAGTGGSLPIHSTCPGDAEDAYDAVVSIVGTIEAENFDVDGYSDLSEGNEGNVYRTDVDVDIKEVDSGHALGWMQAGEWLEYTVEVPSSGDYVVSVRAGSAEPGRSLELSSCGTLLGSTISVPQVPDWGQFEDTPWMRVSLAAGIQVIRISVSGLDYLDLDSITFAVDDGQAGTGGESDDDGDTGPRWPDFFVGNITTFGQVRPDFIDYWDQITPENEGKWGSVESTRDQYNWDGLDRAYDYAKANDIPFKQHTFVWGSQAPNWIDGLPPSQQAAEIEEWIRDYCERYPDTEMIDVVNEATPGHAPAGYAQSAFGSDWIIESFQLARQYCPNSVLILNDYNVLTWNTDGFIDMATPAVQAGVVDAIGLQAHGWATWSLNDLQTNMAKVVALGLPIYISEYDLDIADDEQQRAVMVEQFTWFYSHPSVVGITLWGYVVGGTWVDHSGLIDDDGTQRPAMTWLMDYLDR